MLAETCRLAHGVGGYAVAMLALLDSTTRTARAIAWARRIMIHGAGAKIAHYEAAVLAAQARGRCLIVECSSATLPAWIDLARAAAHRPPTLIIEPRNGVHPLPLDRRAMQ